MLNKIKEFFRDEGSLEVDGSGKVTPEDLQVATGVLLLEMAGSDSDYAPEEVTTIFATMAKQFNIERDRAAELLEMADSLREKHGKIDQFVKTINENFSPEQRQTVLAMVWRVILADEMVEKSEERFALQIRTRLQLSEEQAAEAKARAQQGEV